MQTTRESSLSVAIRQTMTSSELRSALPEKINRQNLQLR